MSNDEKIPNFLEKLLDEMEKNPPEDKNGGHKALLADLTSLIKEAMGYQFDDFRNTLYPAPKITLVQKFEELKQNTMNGKYDN